VHLLDPLFCPLALPPPGPFLAHYVLRAVQYAPCPGSFAHQAKGPHHIRRQDFWTATVDSFQQPCGFRLGAVRMHLSRTCLSGTPPQVCRSRRSRRRYQSSSTEWSYRQCHDSLLDSSLFLGTAGQTMLATHFSMQCYVIRCTVLAYSWSPCGRLRRKWHFPLTAAPWQSILRGTPPPSCRVSLG
jgi:hypothetical protein